MEKIKKAYSTKIISLAVIMCFLTISAAYPDTLSKKYCLRAQLDFNQERVAVTARYNQALKDYVEYNGSLRNRAMQVIASLRLNIKENENLAAQEFEEHIRMLAGELKVDYKVKRIGFIDFFDLAKIYFQEQK